jgi:hypothetical protein
MLRSLELRWFIKGIMPTDVYQWFTDILPGNETFEEKPRLDYYLTTQSDDLGIKFSRQQLQVKIRKDKVNFTLNNNNIQGSLEYWIRYDWNDLHSKENTKIDKLYERFSSLKIDKKRLIRKYKILDNQLVQIPLSNQIDAQCSIEITEINMKEQAWSTLGFDWFLNNEIPESPIIDDYITNNESFKKSIKELFNQYTDYKITNTPNSFGYPYFLSKISKEGKHLYQI